MSKFNLKGIVQYLQPNVDGLAKMLHEELTAMEYEILTDNDNYIVGIPKNLMAGKAPKICFVAHMDTIARKRMSLIFKGTKITNDDSVLGADDRAGVFAIMETVKNAANKPMVIFTNYEESGGLGVKVLVKAKILEPYVKHINLFIEPDRQDHRQYVFYSTVLPKEIHAFAQSFGFKPDHGSYSDVKDLTQAYKIPHLNLSVGYYSQHSSNENLDIMELDYTQKAMARMLVSNVPKTIMSDSDCGIYKAPAHGNWGGSQNPTQGASSRTTPTTAGGTSIKTTRGTYYSFDEYNIARKAMLAGTSSTDSPKSTSEEGLQASSCTALVVIDKNSENAQLFHKPPHQWLGEDWAQFNQDLRANTPSPESDSSNADVEDEFEDLEGTGISMVDVKDISYEGQMYTAREYAKLLQDKL